MFLFQVRYVYCSDICRNTIRKSYYLTKVKHYVPDGITHVIHYYCTATSLFSISRKNTKPISLWKFHRSVSIIVSSNISTSFAYITIHNASRSYDIAARTVKSWKGVYRYMDRNGRRLQCRPICQICTVFGEGRRKIVHNCTTKAVFLKFYFSNNSNITDWRRKVESQQSMECFLNKTVTMLRITPIDEISFPEPLKS